MVATSGKRLTLHFVHGEWCKMTQIRAARLSRKKFLEAIEGSGGIKMLIASRMKCSRVTVDKYIHEYPEVAEAYSSEVESLNDMVESKLISKIQEENSLPAMIFYLKCKGKNRGWVERQEVEHTGPRPIVVSSEWEGLLEEN